MWQQSKSNSQWFNGKTVDRNITQLLSFPFWQNDRRNEGGVCRNGKHFDQVFKAQRWLGVCWESRDRKQKPPREGQWACSICVWKDHLFLKCFKNKIKKQQNWSSSLFTHQQAVSDDNTNIYEKWPEMVEVGGCIPRTPTEHKEPEEWKEEYLGFPLKKWRQFLKPVWTLLTMWIHYLLSCASSRCGFTTSGCLLSALQHHPGRWIHLCHSYWSFSLFLSQDLVHIVKMSDATFSFVIPSFINTMYWTSLGLLLIVLKERNEMKAFHALTDVSY